MVRMSIIMLGSEVSKNIKTISAARIVPNSHQEIELFGDLGERR